jgi:hypothetical protein
MNKTATWTLAAGGILGVIFLAGFFHSEASLPADPMPLVCKSPPPPPACVAAGEPRPCDKVEAPASLPASQARGLLALTNGPSYKRAGDLTLRVADCTKAEDDLEAKLVSLKGEIVDMVMEGTEGSRTCTLSAIIPADQFRAFIVDLRKMGRVQSERITASKLRPGQAEGSALAGAPDPRELSLVSVRMADEKVAQTVLESRGVLATSFDRSACHFMKGLAVIVELFGLALPFLLALAALAVPALVVLRRRRPRPAGI